MRTQILKLKNIFIVHIIMKNKNTNLRFKKKKSTWGDKNVRH